MNVGLPTPRIFKGYANRALGRVAVVFLYRFCQGRARSASVLSLQDIWAMRLCVIILGEL